MVPPGVHQKLTRGQSRRLLVFARSPYPSHQKARMEIGEPNADAAVPPARSRPDSRARGALGHAAPGRHGRGGHQDRAAANGRRHARLGASIPEGCATAGTRPSCSYFLSANRAKKSVTVDIATADGQDLIRRIAAKSDVVIENYKVGTLGALRARLQRSQRAEPALDLLLADRVRPDRTLRAICRATTSCSRAWAG